MSSTKRAPRELWAALLADVTDDELRVDVGADDVNRQSVLRLAHAEERARLRLRLHGAGVDGHDIPARIATSVIAQIQDVVTAIGASIIGQATKAGSVSASVQRATELRMTPAIGFGSIVFNLVPRDLNDPGLMDRAEGGDGGDNGTLLEQSLDRAFDLISTVARDDLDDKEALRQIKVLGPRARSHLLHLAGSLTSGQVEVDAEWTTPNGRARQTTINSRAAAALQRVAREKYKHRDPHTITGYLVTVSSEERQALRFPDGTKVHLDADAALQAELAKHFDKLVRLDVMTETTVTVSSGVERQTHRVQSVTPLY